MTGHSVIAPSSAARRVQCTASTRAEAAYPDEEGTAAAEGTAGHWAAAQAVAGRVVAEGQITPQGHVLTAEMVEGAELYAEDIAHELESFGLKPKDGQIEQPLVMPNIHPQSWGTPDFWIAVRTSTGWHIFLYDYKFGFRIVEVFENWQLVEYIAGILLQVVGHNVGQADQHVRVTAKIVQPRAPHRNGPIRSWTFTASDIRGHINIASMAASEALGPTAKFRVGPECTDCRARRACETLQRAALTACDIASQGQPFDLPPHALALEYRTLKRYSALMEARISGLEEQALALARAGTSLPGLRVEHGAGRETWTVPAATVIQIGQALGVNIAKPPEPLTPKQAVKAGLSEAVLAGITTTPRGAARLVEDDGSLARRVFG